MNVARTRTMARRGLLLGAGFPGRGAAHLPHPPAGFRSPCWQSPLVPADLATLPPTTPGPSRGAGRDGTGRELLRRWKQELGGQQGCFLKDRGPAGPGGRNESFLQKIIILLDPMQFLLLGPGIAQGGNKGFPCPGSWGFAELSWLGRSLRAAGHMPLPASVSPSIVWVQQAAVEWGWTGAGCRSQAGGHSALRAPHAAEPGLDQGGLCVFQDPGPV